MSSKFAFPTTIHFGPVRESSLRALDGARLQAPADRYRQGLAALAGARRVPRDARGLEVGVYSGVQGNPVASQVRAGVDAYRAHRADSVIGLAAARRSMSRRSSR
jgi:alcohol dehydrogenase class IV